MRAGSLFASKWTATSVVLLGMNALAGCGGAFAMSDEVASEQQGAASTFSVTAEADTTLREAEPTKNFGTKALCHVNGVRTRDNLERRSCLVQWGMPDLPGDVRVVSAAITLTVDASEDSQTRADYQLFELTTDWSEPSASWSRPRADASWEAPGALGAADRGAAVIGELVGNGKTGGHVVNLNAVGVAMVQSWVSSKLAPPNKNFGIVISNSENTDVVRLRTSEHVDAESRPKLEVRYLLGD